MPANFQLSKYWKERSLHPSQVSSQSYFKILFYFLKKKTKVQKQFMNFYIALKYVHRSWNFVTNSTDNNQTKI